MYLLYVNFGQIFPKRGRDRNREQIENDRQNMDLALIEGIEVISKYFFVNFCNRAQNVNLTGYLVI